MINMNIYIKFRNGQAPQVGIFIHRSNTSNKLVGDNSNK